MGATLVTGATRGIGRAIVDMLQIDGYDVVGVARTPDASFPAPLYLCDLEDPAATADLLKQLTSRYEFDNLVNNAGLNVVERVEDLEFASFWKVQQVNLRAPLQIVQALVAGMQKRKYGRIVNISSRAQLGLEGHSSYAASKAGLTAMSRCWALELAAYGITVNNIAPGPVDTELFWSVMPPDSEQTQRYLSSVPLQRLSKPSEIAAAVRYFLGRDAGFVTGQTLFVCGGVTVGRSLAP